MKILRKCITINNDLFNIIKYSSRMRSIAVLLYPMSRVINPMSYLLFRIKINGANKYHQKQSTNECHHKPIANVAPTNINASTWSLSATQIKQTTGSIKSDDNVASNSNNQSRSVSNNNSRITYNSSNEEDEDDNNSKLEYIVTSNLAIYDIILYVF